MPLNSSQFFAVTIERQFVRAKVELATAKRQLSRVRGRIWSLEKGAIGLADDATIDLDQKEVEVLYLLARGGKVNLRTRFKSPDADRKFLSRLYAKLRITGIEIILERNGPIYMDADSRHGAHLLADRFKPRLPLPSSVSENLLPPGATIQDQLARAREDVTDVRRQLVEFKEHERVLKEQPPILGDDKKIQLAESEAELLERLMIKEFINIDSIHASPSTARNRLANLNRKLKGLGVIIITTQGKASIRLNHKHLILSNSHIFSPPLRLTGQAPVRGAAQPAIR